MVSFNQDGNKKRFRKLKIILLILPPLLIVPAVILLDSSNDIMFGIGMILLFLLFIDIGIVIGLLTKKYYNWIIAFLVLIVIAVFFKHNRWPFASVFFTFGFGGLGFVSLFSSFTFLKRYRHIPFIRFIGFSSSLVLFVLSMGLLWKNMHWPLAGTFINVGLITFIPFLFAFVFTIPNANFMNWNKLERIVFFRAIIIPMIFVYGICVMMFVFPEFWTSLLHTALWPFGMEPIELLDKAGLH